eukprot:Hpha_TRINITY_DN22050_c0_g1::TRINITY_DN22050_c0_g1_i1::g.112192::m.112192/K01408/IDE, ide; insulysin
MGRLSFACSFAVFGLSPIWADQCLTQAQDSNVPRGEYDSRAYRALELPNRLRVLLVSDKQTSKAAAAAAVGVGSMSDPGKWPGLAHFLEHMLFLGSDRYPNEGEYGKFVSAHNGYTNAYTAQSITNYYFQVDADALNATTDRMARFFVSPLLRESGVEREVNAVNNEHEKNLQNDGWREWQLVKSLAKPDSPVHSFSTGDKSTLDKPGVGDALRHFHKQHYSSNLMTAALVGPQTLDVLEEIARSAFSPIQDKDLSSPEWPPPAYAETAQGKWVTVRGVQPQRVLRLIWAHSDWEAINPESRNRVSQILGFLLSHQGQGTASAVLRERGWTDDTSADDYANFLPQRSGLFCISATLTEQGEKDVKNVIAVLVHYLLLITHEFSLSDKAAHKLVDDANLTANLRFTFPSRSDPGDIANSLTARMQENKDPLDYTEAPSRLVFDPDLIRRFLGLLKPEKVIVLLRTPDGVLDGTKKKEPVYGTEYAERDLTRQELAAWSPAGLVGIDGPEADLIRSLHLPEANPFIPSEEELAQFAPNSNSSDNSAQVASAPPELLMNKSGLVVWHKNSIFDQPKTSVRIRFAAARPQLDQAKEPPRRAATRAIYEAAINLALKEIVYQASVGLMGVSVDMDMETLSVELNGLSPKQPALLASIAKVLADPFLDGDKRFEVAQEQVYVNTGEALLNPNPYNLALNLVGEATAGWAPLREMQQQIRQITMAEIRGLAGEYLSNRAAELIVVGNPTSPSDFVGHITAALGLSGEANPTIWQRWAGERRGKGIEGYGTRLPEGWTVLRDTQDSKDNSNSAVWTVWQMHPAMEVSTDEIFLQLLGKAIQSPFFEQLRTVEQLGYVVDAADRAYGGTRAIRAIVQSSTEDPNTLDGRVEAFMRNFALSEFMTDDSEFEALRVAIAARLQELPVDIDTEADRVEAECTYHTHRWTRKQEILELLNSPKINRAAFFDWFRQKVLARGRRKLSGQIFSQVRAQSDPGASTRTVVDSKQVHMEQAPSCLCNSILAETRRVAALSKYGSVSPNNTRQDLRPRVEYTNGATVVSVNGSGVDGAGCLSRVIVTDQNGTVVALAEKPPGKAVTFEVQGSAGKDLTAWALWDDAGLVGSGASKQLGEAGPGAQCSVAVCGPGPSHGSPTCAAPLSGCPAEIMFKLAPGSKPPPETARLCCVSGSTDAGVGCDYGREERLKLERRAHEYPSLSKEGTAKHLPTISYPGGPIVRVTVEKHPMVVSADPDAVHYIDTLYVVNAADESLLALQTLAPSAPAPAMMEMLLPPGVTSIRAFSFCNIHGLVVSELEVIPEVVITAAAHWADPMRLETECAAPSCLSLPPPPGSADVRYGFSSTALRDAYNTHSYSAHQSTQTPIVSDKPGGGAPMWVYVICFPLLAAVLVFFGYRMRRRTESSRPLERGGSYEQVALRQSGDRDRGSLSPNPQSTRPQLGSDDGEVLI